MPSRAMLAAALLALLSRPIMAGNAVGSFNENTIAFYPFDEGTVGEYLETQRNAVDGERFAGTAVRDPANQGASTMRMSDESPGKYIFSGSQTRDRLVYVQPRSLRLGSGARSSSPNTYGYLEIPSISAELSNHHDTGITIEFFFKLDPGDGWYPNSYQIGFDAGYLINGTSNARIKTLLPTSREYETRLVVNSTASGVNNKDIVAATDVRKKVSGFTSFRDGNWHHYAFVEDPSTKAISYYIDRQLVGSNTMANMNLTTQQIASGGFFNIGRVNGNEYSFGAAISCLRFSKAALAADEFLVAGDAAWPEGTIAAYEFLDGAEGESAVGASTLKNSVDGLSNAGSVVVSTAAGANPSVVFDSDAPFPYLFRGVRSMESAPLYSNPQSIVITSDLVGSAAQIQFARLGTALSQLHSDGYTIEYFVKYVDERQSNYPPAFMSYHAGYGSSFRLYMPVAVNDNWRRSVVYSIGSRETPGAVMYSGISATDYLADGKWHHVAVVAQPYDAGTGKVSISVWIDKVKYGSIGVSSPSELTTAESLTMCHGSNYHCKLACITLSRGALASSDFLKGYSTPCATGAIISIW